MVRMSSPGVYSRTSSNSIPRPLKTEWYSPASDSFTSRLVRISIRRTFFRISWEVRGISANLPRPSDGGGSGHFDRVQDPQDDLLRRDVLGLGLVGEQDAMPEHVEGDRLHVLRGRVPSPLHEGVGLGGQGEVDGGPGRGAEGDQARQVQLVLLGGAGGEHDVDDVVP